MCLHMAAASVSFSSFITELGDGARRLKTVTAAGASQVGVRSRDSLRHVHVRFTRLNPKLHCRHVRCSISLSGVFSAEYQTSVMNTGLTTK